MAHKKRKRRILQIVFSKRVIIITLLLFINSFFAIILLQSKKNVRSNNFPELQDVKVLTQRNAPFPVLEKYFQNLADKKGAPYAFDVLKIAQLPPSTDLHLLGHAVGDILYKQKGYLGIKICTDDFRNACSHSIVIGLLHDKGERALSQIAQACREAPGGKGAYTMCFHGLGHGILAYTNYDLPSAIKICKKTGTQKYNFREYDECVGGTIMEIVGGGFHARNLWEIQSQKYLSSEDPLSPCDQDFIEERTKYMCYEYLTPHFFILAGGDLGNLTANDFEKAFTYCNTLPLSDKNRIPCFGGFGKEFVGVAKARDIRNIEAMTTDELQKVYIWCTLAKDADGIQYCISHSLSSLYWGGENKPEMAIKFCALIPDQQYKSACYNDLIKSVRYYISDTRYKKSFCEQLGEKIKENCKQELEI